jgi:DNA-binding beta-propeller fold protein YncE
VFSSEGSANGEFEIPEYISASPGGQIFVADENNSRVQEFSSTGQFLNTWGSGGDTSGLFTNPLGLDADVAGNVYVADEGNARIEKFYLGANPCTKGAGRGRGGRSRPAAAHAVPARRGGLLLLFESDRPDLAGDAGLWATLGFDRVQSVVAIDEPQNLLQIPLFRDEIRPFPAIWAGEKGCSRRKV